MTWASAGRARLSWEDAWGEAMTEPKKAAVAARERMDAIAGTGREGWTGAAERAVGVQRSWHQGQGSGDAEYLKAGAVRGASGRGTAAKVHRASAMYKTRWYHCAADPSNLADQRITRSWAPALGGFPRSWAGGGAGPRTRPRMRRRRPGVKSRRTAPASPPCLDELGVEERTSRRARALHSHIGSMAHYPPEERHRGRPHSTAGLDPYTRRVGARSTAPRIQGEMTASQLPSAAGPRCHDAGTQGQTPVADTLLCSVVSL